MQLQLSSTRRYLLPSPLPPSLISQIYYKQWFLCDDARVSKIKDIHAAIGVSKERNGEPIMFAYKQIKG